MRAVKVFIGAFIVMGAAVLMFHAGWAVADTAPEQRFDELQKRVGGVGAPAGKDASQASVEQALEWYGLLGVSYKIKELEQKADALLFGSSSRGLLAEKMKHLEGQAKTKGTMAAEGAIGGGNQAPDGNRGLAWYCNKVKELEGLLPQRTQALADNAADYLSQLNSIPAGRDDSAAQAESLTTRFSQGIRDWHVHKDTVAIDKAVREVSAGLGTARDTFGGIDGLANAAADEARKLKAEAREIEKLYDPLTPRVDPYVARRKEVLRELQGLQLEYDTDLQKRADLVKTVQGLHAPKSSTSGWRTILDEAVAQRRKAADEALSRIDALTSSIRKQESACADREDPAAKFQALLKGEQRKIDIINEGVNKAWANRLLKITNLDKEHADLIATEEKTAEDLGKKIVDAEKRYDNPQHADYRSQKLYQNIVKARELGAAASNSAVTLKISRQGVQKEQQAAQRQSTVISGELQGAVSWLYRW